MFALIRKASTDGLAAFVPGVVAAASGMNGSSSAQEVHLLNGLDPTQVSFDRDLMSPPTSRRKPNINPDSQSTTTTAPSPHETSIMDDGLFSLHGADNSEGDVISSGGSSTNQPSSGASIHVVVAGTMELLGVPELEEKLTRLKKFELKYPDLARHFEALAKKCNQMESVIKATTSLENGIQTNRDMESFFSYMLESKKTLEESAAENALLKRQVGELQELKQLEATAKFEMFTSLHAKLHEKEEELSKLRNPQTAASSVVAEESTDSKQLSETTLRHKVRELADALRIVTKERDKAVEKCKELALSQTITPCSPPVALAKLRSELDVLESRLRTEPLNFEQVTGELGCLRDLVSQLEATFVPNRAKLASEAADEAEDIRMMSERMRAYDDFLSGVAQTVGADITCGMDELTRLLSKLKLQFDEGVIAHSALSRRYEELADSSREESGRFSKALKYAEDRIVSLESELTRLSMNDGDSEKFRTECSRLSREIEASQVRETQLIERENKVKAQLAAVESGTTELKVHIESLSAMLASKDKALSDYRKQFDDSASALQAAEERCRELQSLVEAHKEEVSLADKKFEKLKAAFAKAIAEVKSSQLIRDSLTASVARLEAEKAELVSQLPADNAENQERKILTLEEALAEQSKQADASLESLQTALAELKNLDAQHSNLQSRFHTLENKHSETLSEVSKLSQEYESMTSRLSDAERTAEKLASDCRMHIERIDELSRNVMQLEVALRTTQESLSQHKLEAQAAENELTERISELTIEKAGIYQRYEQISTSTSDTISRLVHETEEKTQQLLNANSTLEKCQSDLLKCEDDLHRCAAERAAIEMHLAEARLKVESLEITTAKLEEALSDTSAACVSKDESILRLQENATSASTHLEKVERDLSTCKAELSRCQNEILREREVFESKIHQLEGEVQQLKAEKTASLSEVGELEARLRSEINLLVERTSSFSTLELANRDKDREIARLLALMDSAQQKANVESAELLITVSDLQKRLAAEEAMVLEQTRQLDVERMAHMEETAKTARHVEAQEAILQDEIKKLQSDLLSIQTRLSERQSNSDSPLIDSAVKVEELEKCLNQERAERCELENQISRAQQAVIESQTALREYEQLIQALRDAEAELIRKNSKEISIWTERFEEAVNGRKAAETETLALQSELAKAKELLDEGLARATPSEVDLKRIDELVKTLTENLVGEKEETAAAKHHAEKCATDLAAAKADYLSLESSLRIETDALRLELSETTMRANELTASKTEAEISLDKLRNSTLQIAHSLAQALDSLSPGSCGQEPQDVEPNLLREFCETAVSNLVMIITNERADRMDAQKSLNEALQMVDEAELSRLSWKTLKTKTAELEADNERLNADFSAAVAALQEQKQAISFVRAELDTSRSLSAKQSAQLEAAETEVIALKRKNGSLSEQLEALNQRIEGLIVQVGDTEKQNVELQNSADLFAETKAKLSDVEAEKSSMEVELASLREKFEELNRDRSIISKALEDAVAERTALLRKLEELESSSAIVEKRRTELELQIKCCTELLNKSRSELGFSDEKNLYTALQSMLSHLESSVREKSQIVLEVVELRSDVEAAQRDKSALSHDIEKYKLELQEHATKLLRIESERSPWQARAQDAESQIASMKSTLAERELSQKELSQREADLLDKLQALSAEHEAALLASESFVQEKKQLVDRLQEMDASLQKTREEKNDIFARLVEALRIAEEHKKREKDLSDLSEKLTADCSSLRVEIQRMQAELSTNRTEMEAANKERRELQDLFDAEARNSKALQEHITRLNAEMSSLVAHAASIPQVELLEAKLQKRADEVKQLEEQLVNSKKELDTAAERETSLRAQFEQLFTVQLKVSELEEQVRFDDGEKQSLQADIQSLKIKQDLRQKEIDELNVLVKQLEDHLREANIAISDAERQRATKSAQLDELARELGGARKTADGLKNELADAQARAMMAEQSLALSKQTAYSLNESVQEYEKKLEAIRKQLAEEEEKKMKSIQLLRTSKARILRMEETIKQKEEQISSLANELSGVKEQAEAGLRDKESELARHIKEVVDLTNRLKSQRDEIDELEHQKSQKENELENAVFRAKDLQLQLTRLTAERDNLKGEIRQTENQKRADDDEKKFFLTHQASQLSTRVAELEARISTLDDELETSKRLFEHKSAEAEALKMKISELEMIIYEHEQAAQLTTDQFRQRSDEITSLRKEVASKTSELAKAADAVVEANGIKRQAQEELAIIRSQLQKDQAELADLRGKEERLLGLVKEAEVEIANKGKECKSLEAKLADAVDSRDKAIDEAKVKEFQLNKLNRALKEEVRKLSRGPGSLSLASLPRVVSSDLDENQSNSPTSVRSTSNGASMGATAVPNAPSGYPARSTSHSLRHASSTSSLSSAATSQDRSSEPNVEYLRNVFMKFLEAKKENRMQMIPALGMMLQLSPDDIKKVQRYA